MQSLTKKPGFRVFLLMLMLENLDFFFWIISENALKEKLLNLLTKGNFSLKLWSHGLMTLVAVESELCAARESR